MSKRFTDTEKWGDSWFQNLQPVEKLLFYYLIDKVDNAGFYEISYRYLTFEIGFSRAEIEGALKGLQRGLVVGSKGLEDGAKIYLKNFLKHQNILPLNLRNNYCKNVLKAFQNHINFIEKNKFFGEIFVFEIDKKEILSKELLINFLKKQKGLQSTLVDVVVEVEVEVEGEVKVKKEKVKILKIPETEQKNGIPTLEEFINYAISEKPNVCQIATELKYKAWLNDNWRTNGKTPKPIRNWKTTLLNTLAYIPETKNNNKKQINGKSETTINRQTAEQIRNSAQGWG